MEYILTLEQLESVSLQNLGPMVKGQFDHFEEQAYFTKVALPHRGMEINLQNPRLIIETRLKQPSIHGVIEVIYPVSEQEWDDFEIDPQAEYTPNVHVVDGAKYTACI